MKRPERVLVTGAAGFIGSTLVERLLADGREVIGVDSFDPFYPESIKRRNLTRALGARRFRLEHVDIRDAGRLERIFADSAFDGVVHLAALAGVRPSLERPAQYADVNVHGSAVVFEVAARHGRPRVVFASSSSVYGEQPTYPLRERQRPLPCSPYGVSKLAGEIYCAMWWRTMRVPVVALRYFNVYGPRQDASSEYAVVVPRFVLACLTGQRPVIDGDGAQARDFAYIDDVVEANLLAARAREDAFGAAFNIGGGAEPTSVNRLLAMIADITGATPRPLHAPPRPGDVRLTCADLALAGRVLGYQPAVGMRAGLRRTVEWFRSEIDRTEIDRTVPARR
jgi:nucleoside-diphosphate-sugar epimerase